MNQFLHRLLTTVFSVMLVVLPPAAQENPDEPSPAPTAPEKPETSLEKEQPGKRSSRRGKSSKTTYSDITMVGAPVKLNRGESAREVVVVGADAEVDGQVTGNLIVLLGNLRLGPESQVAYGPTVVGGTFISEPGARLGVNPTVISPALVFGLTNAIHPALWKTGQRWVGEGLLLGRPLPHQLPAAWIVSGLLLLFFVLIGVLFQRPVQKSVAILDEKPGSALLFGVLVCVLSVPLLLLLIVSVVGLVFVPFVAIAMGVFFIIGKVAVYRYAGQTLGSQLGVSFLQNPVLALIAGALLLYVAYAIPVIGGVVWVLVALLGLGAVMLAGVKRTRPQPAPVVAVPGVALPAGAPPELSSASTVTLPRAGFWLRLTATVLDFVLVGLLMAIFFHRNPPQWFLLAWTLYHLAFWTWRGTTIGGTILGLRIVRTDGQPMNLPVALVRLLGGFFSAAVFGLGFFWAGWSQDKQSWHDKIAGTVVVRFPKSPPLL